MNKPAIPPPAKNRNPESRATGMPVLIIDDSDIDRATMSELLTSAGFQVHALPTPIGATRVARELKVQVVVIDQNLPALDGNKLAALFRGNPGMRDIRVVLVSGNDDAQMHEMAKQAQVDVFLSKRDLHRQLVEVVKRLSAPT